MGLIITSGVFGLAFTYLAAAIYRLVKLPEEATSQRSEGSPHKRITKGY